MSLENVAAWLLFLGEVFYLSFQFSLVNVLTVIQGQAETQGNEIFYCTTSYKGLSESQAPLRGPWV